MHFYAIPKTLSAFLSPVSFPIDLICPAYFHPYYELLNFSVYPECFIQTRFCILFSGFRDQLLGNWMVYFYLFVSTVFDHLGETG